MEDIKETLSYLTILSFCLKLRAMTVSLNTLESIARKVDRLVALCDKLSVENASLQTENLALKARIENACGQLEALMTRMPDE